MINKLPTIRFDNEVLEETTEYFKKIAKKIVLKIIWLDTIQIPEYVPDNIDLTTDEIYINLRYDTKYPIPFRLAHGISHKLLNPNSKGKKNFTDSVEEESERKTNIRAIQLLAERYFSDGIEWNYLSNFQEAFNIKNFKKE